jgi:2'-5' RNA ligase
MKPNIQTIPGYRVNEYLLVLQPHEELQHKISLVRKQFQQDYRTHSFANGRPRLTLARFTQIEMMEERILNRLASVAMGHYPFKVELKDYGSFPSHTIFINVGSKLPLRGLVSKLKTGQKLMKMDNEHKPHFIDEPFIPVAGKLLPWQYEKGWLEYRNRQFTGRFIADAMLLLKKRVGDQSYQVLSRLAFMNLPVNVRQGDLFN